MASIKYIILAAAILFSSCTKKKGSQEEIEVPKFEPRTDLGVPIPKLPTLPKLDSEEKIEYKPENLRGVKNTWPYPVVVDGKMKVDGSWQIVYNGKYTDYKKNFVILDLFEFSTTDIAKCQFPIAYFSAHYEDWRPDKHKFGKKLKGISGWKGENYVQWDDPKNQQVMISRLDLAVQKGFKGVDIDNIDGPNSVPYFSWLLTESKKRGLAVGMKNTVEHLNIFGDKVDFFVSEASALGELTCYKKYNKPVVRMYYGKGAKTPDYIYEIRSGKNGNKF